VGASEILAAITSLEFFYSQAPISMRSVSQSLNLFTNALGSFLVIPVLLLVNSDPGKARAPPCLSPCLSPCLAATASKHPSFLHVTNPAAATPIAAIPGNEWVPTNLDDGHLDYYFFLLAGLMGLTLVSAIPSHPL
jgi:peptide/histidine transporter 3/4